MSRLRRVFRPVNLFVALGVIAIAAGLLLRAVRLKQDQAEVIRGQEQVEMEHQLRVAQDKLDLALVKFQLLQTVDFSDPEKVKELMKSSAPAAPAAAPKDSPEVALLKQQLREAESRSNQPSGSGSPVAPANPLQAQLAKGKRIGRAINARTSANPYFASRN